MTGAETVRIDLLRHGEVQGGARYRGATDDRLTATGWQQMWAAVENGAHWQGVVTSPLARCAEFARALARRRSLPLQLDERLREMDFGLWEGRTAAELIETDADALSRFWRAPWRHPPPGGESLARLAARVLAAWRDALARGQCLLVITHGGPIRVILHHVRGLATEALTQIEVPYGARYAFFVAPSDAALLEPAAP